MKERPIIFSTESVRAILDGRKTKTRRAMKPQPLPYCGFKYGIDEDGEWYELHHYKTKTNEYPMVKRIYPAKKLCPFGIPGDRLWVKEAFVCAAGIPELGGNCTCDEYVLYGDTAPVPAVYPPQKPKLTSPVAMPRDYSRITLEITAVRCEQIKSISEDDRFAEGYDSIGKYIDNWNILNAKRGYDWESNPWVWVIEFKQVNGGAA